MWCRAFAGTHVTPVVLGDLELFEIGILLGGDIEVAEPIPRYVAPPAEPLAEGEPRPATRVREVD